MANKRTNGRPKGFHMNNDQKAKYAELFENALDEMESANYQKPWVSPCHATPMNMRYKKPYRGINNFLLTLLCALKGWDVPYFLTFDQIKSMGLSLNVMLDDDGMAVIKDNGMPEFEKSFPVVYMLRNIYHGHERITQKEYEELDDEEKDECRFYFGMRPFAEFNICQTDFRDKFPEKWAEMTAIPPHDYEAGTVDKVLDRMIHEGDWRCSIEFGGHRSCYIPASDVIRLPKRSQFLGDQMFYATTIHEMAHSTAGDEKCKRNVLNEFGTPEYAREEFVAELTAACVCSMLGIGKLLDEQHIAYVQSWRKAIREEDDFIVKVIDDVQYATNYILRRYEQVAKAMEMPLALPLAA